VVGAIVGVLMAGRLWVMARRGERVWIFYAVLLGVPAAIVCFRRPVYLFPRYFVVLAPFVYALVAGALVEVGRRWQGVAMVAGGLWVAGQAVLVAGFLHVGRGNPSAAVSLMGANTPGAEVSVTSVDRARARVELAYFNRFLPAGKHFVFMEDFSHGVPAWLLVHGEAGAAPPARVVVEHVGWVREGWWDASVMSGQVWGVYRRESGGGGSAGAVRRGKKTPAG
jgi:hypothetical protein